MKLLNDLFAFAQQHEATMTVLSAWFAREFLASVPFIKWIWNSELGVLGILRRFFLGVPKQQPAPTTGAQPQAVK